MKLIFLISSSSVVAHKNWIWQPVRSDDLVKIQSRLSMVNIGDVDQPTWKFSKNGVYNCATTWEVIRHKQ